MKKSVPFQYNQYLHSPDIDAAQEFLNTRIEKREITPLSYNKFGSNTMNMQSLGKTLVFGVHWKDKIHIVSDTLSTFHLIMPLSHSIKDQVTKARVNKGDILISSPGNCMDVIWDEGCTAFVTTFDINALKHYFQVDSSILMNQGTQIIRAKEHISQSLSILFTCLSQQHQIHQGSIKAQMQKHFESLLLDSLSDHILTNDIIVLPKNTKRVIDWIMSDLHRPFDITELISVSGCSRRSLENSFKHYTGMSPAKYVVSQKLHAINKLLKNSPSESVGELAFQFDFTSPSHFTKLYKNSFGETPSETLGNRPSIYISSHQKL